jgi:hypothetical protein
MGVIGNRYLQGSPILPYANVKAYPNTDLFLDLQFVDHTNTPVIPLTINIEIDDITNSVVLPNCGPIALNAAGAVGTAGSPFTYPAFAATMYLQVLASAWQMTFPYIGSQLCQVGMQFTAIDSVTGQQFTGTGIIAIIELCALATVSGLTY